MNRHDRPFRTGFTLIELLIVIAIISILVAGLVMAVAGTVQRTRIKATEATIQMLLTALGSYKNAFGSYPPVYSFAGGPQSTEATGTEDDLLNGNCGFSSADLSGTSAANRRRRNNSIRIYLETKFEGIRDSPFIKQSDEVRREDVSGNDLREYADPWHQALVFNCPGEYHVLDEEEDDAGNPTGVPVPGTDTSRFIAGGAGDALPASKWPFEIYSFGADEKDNYNHTRVPGTHRDDICSFLPDVGNK
ncbi:MAG: type II secretion system protein [Planctomycetes bacterium]|nr:type II secretion system protein [Planctomycetota bacterium]